MWDGPARTTFSRAGLSKVASGLDFLVLFHQGKRTIEAIQNGLQGHRRIGFLLSNLTYRNPTLFQNDPIFLYCFATRPTGIKTKQAARLDSLSEYTCIGCYTRKCENALFASAIRCVSSFFFTAAPSPLAAAMISFASLSAIVLPLRSRA